jgi:cytochrome o ubiquinol oxidase subunit 3
MKLSTQQEGAHDSFRNSTFGFWLYLMTDAVLFAVLFVTYAVLHGATYGAPNSQEIINLPRALAQTVCLLLSSFTCSMGMLTTSRNNRGYTLFWFTGTVLFGLSFLFVELWDFRTLILQVHTWQKSGFLSAYFTLIGTHSLHILIGLIFLSIFLLQLIIQGFSQPVVRRLTCFSLFWYFSYIIWILMFTLVDLIGVIG